MAQLKTGRRIQNLIAEAAAMLVAMLLLSQGLWSLGLFPAYEPKIGLSPVTFRTLCAWPVAAALFAVIVFSLVWKPFYPFTKSSWMSVLSLPLALTSITGAIASLASSTPSALEQRIMWQSAFEVWATWPVLLAVFGVSAAAVALAQLSVRYRERKASSGSALNAGSEG